MNSEGLENWEAIKKSMKLCPLCQRCYEDSDLTCVQAGHETLVAVRSGERLIADKYRLDRLLARGGMGTVYIGTHIELDRAVAIKLLLPNFSADPQAFERFRREARAAAKIKHPNIADVYDYGTLADGESYIVMELVEGETLQERLRNMGKLPIAEALMISRQIADGMEAAHHSGIVHRDLKPSNIILTQAHDGSRLVKIVDFGIAKISEQIAAEDATLTATGTLVGTPRYMSPEQCLGDNLDERSDIYSFGVILYEMLAGQPPFDAPSAVAIAVKRVNELPPPIEERCQDVPPMLAHLISDLLSVDPSGRPQTATELRQRLVEFEAPADQNSATDDIGSALPSEEVDELRTQVFTDEERTAHASTDEYATSVSFPQPDDEPEKIPQVLFQLGDQPIKQAVPLTSRTPAVDVSAEPSSPSISNNLEETRVGPVSGLPKKTKVRRSNLSTIFAGLAVAIVIGAAIWTATRQAPSTLSAGSATGTSPAKPVSPMSSAINGASTKAENKSGRERDTEIPETVPPEDGTDAVPEQVRAEITQGLNEWIAATNAGNVDRQMVFYNPTVDVFYRTRNVSRDAVRAEKVRLFDQADRIEVDAGEPQIKFDSTGQTVTTRFRKQYVIEGQTENRRGEVVQELRWIKTDEGWKIIGERDVQVIRNSNKAPVRRNGNPSNMPHQVVVRGLKKLFQAVR